MVDKLRDYFDDMVVYKDLKSEEFENKKLTRKRGFAIDKGYAMENFYVYDRNDEFDDGILKYRDVRAGNFKLEDESQRVRRSEKILVTTLTQCSPLDAPAEFFSGKLETFLTRRALAEKFGTKIGSKTAEEYALVWIHQTLVKTGQITRAEIQQFIRALPEILARPFPLCEKIKKLTQEFVIPNFCEAFKNILDFGARTELLQLQKFLRLIK